MPSQYWFLIGRACPTEASTDLRAEQQVRAFDRSVVTFALIDDDDSSSNEAAAAAAAAGKKPNYGRHNHNDRVW